MKKTARPIRIAVASWILFAACVSLFGESLNGQTVEFKDGKSLPLANEANLLKTRELIRDENWLAAARQALEIMESSGDRLFQIQSTNDCRVFSSGVMRAQILVCNWAETAPQALAAFRELVDAEAQTLFKQAMQTNSVEGLRRVARKYFASRVGDLACSQLARIEFEEGNFLSVATMLDSLIRVENFPGSSHLQFPDSQIPELELMSRSLAASLFAQDFELASQKLQFLSDQYADSKFVFLGKKEQDISDLQSEFDRIQSSFETDSNQENSSWLDIRGRASWSFDLEPQSNDRSPYRGLYPPVAEPGDLTLATIPLVDRDHVYWCDTHHVYRSPVPSPGMSKATATKIWSTTFPKQTIQTERKRLGRPVFDLVLDNGFLFARMGDPTTSYRNDALTRNRSYLIGLDLDRGGSVLPGFPLENQDPRIEFDATPVYHDGYLYVSKRRTFRDNASGQVIIECLELSSSNRVTRPRVVWQKEWVTAESNNRGLWDEITDNRLIMVDRNLICLGSGFVQCLDRINGEVQWVTDYSRDRFEFSRELKTSTEKSGSIVRKQDQLIYHQGYLYVAPSDSDFVICISAATGRCRWRARFPNVTHLLGATDQHLMAGGHKLNWIDITNGRLKSRFPASTPDSTRGFSLPPIRGMGYGAIDGNIVYWPTVNNIFVLGTQLNQPQGKQVATPILYRVIDLKSRKTTGGNLHVENGIMLLANEREIKLYVE